MCELRAACFSRDLERGGWPTVSVIVPIRNEGPHLARAVASILDQEYPILFDVCLAVAPSADDTAAVADRLAATDDRVSVVANPAGVTPAALNAAVRATTGSVVVRVDGHAELSDGYIRRAVETMCRIGAVNVGGMQIPAPETPFEEAVAAATTSWMGTGGATYRVGGTEGPVDTVYLGVFDRAAGDAVGWFDETLIRNQDYEFNIRLRAVGGVVWFDPELSVAYRPRGSWVALARQYFEYGYWKAEVLRRKPGTLQLRQFVPAIAPFILLVATVMSVRRRVAATIPALYVSLILATAVRSSATDFPDVKRAQRRLRVLTCSTALTTMHFAWGAGFWRRVSHLTTRPGSPPRR